MSEAITNSHKVFIGRLLQLRVDTVRLANGRDTTREIVEHPGAVAIVPLLDDDKLIVVKQYRAAARKQLLEIPAGTLEPGEAPLSCAKRELIEETGYSARSFSKLFSCYLAPGYSTEKIHFFLARQLVRTEADPAEDEAIAIHFMNLREGLEAIERGKIQDAKTISALYYLATRKKWRGRTSRRHYANE
jgi:ADP-ribose pyrophosphatase